MATNSSTYCNLINKLGFKYGIFDDVELKIPEICERLYNNIFYLDEEKLLKQMQEIENIFFKAKNYFGYKEIHDVLLFMIKIIIYQAKIISKEKFLKFEKIIDTMGLLDTNLFLYVKFIYTVSISNEYNELFMLFKQLPEDSDNPLILFCILYKNYNIPELNKAKQIANKLEKMIPIDNYNFYFRIKMQELSSITNFNYSQADSEYIKVLSFLENHSQISLRLQQNIYFNYGTFLTSHQRYEEAIVAFDKLKNIAGYNAHNDVFNAICHLKIGKKFTNKLPIESIKDIDWYSCMLKYILMKQDNYSIKILYNYFVEKIIPKCHNYMPSYICDYIRSEAFWLSERSQKYKVILILEKNLIQ